MGDKEIQMLLSMLIIKTIDGKKKPNLNNNEENIYKVLCHF